METPSKTTTIELTEGGVYASRNKEGKFRITKILALDKSAVHVRYYNEQFDEVPDSVSTTNLTFSIGHAPVARDGFLMEERHLIATEQVSDSELEGYKIYLEAMRGQ